MNNNFVRIAILSTVLAASAVGILWVLGVLNTRGDDDKPPVVVSGGSVIIEQQVDAKDEVRGDFEQVVAGDKKKWRAGHLKGQKPKALTVIIENSTSGTTECQPTYVHKKVTSLTFMYRPAGIGVDTPFTAAIVDEALQFDFPIDAEQKADSMFRLTIPEVTLISVTIGTTTCDLGPRGRVEMRQRK